MSVVGGTPTNTKSAMQSFYDSVAEKYVIRDEGVRRYFHNGLELCWLSESTVQGKRFLDVGSGVGRMASFVGDQPSLFVGVDLSHQMLQIAKARCCTHSETAFLLQCDAEHLPFPVESFDIVTCLGLFEYVADLEPFLREFLRVTTPQGRLLFTCHNLSAFRPLRNRSYHTVDYGVDAVRDAVQRTGYTVLRHETTYHLNGRWIWWLNRLLQPIKAGNIPVRWAVKFNRILQKSKLFGYRGKVHLVLAERS